jgi:WD40 repeat protein
VKPLILVVGLIAATCSAQQLRSEGKLESPVPIVYATTCQNGNRVVGIGKDGDIYSWTTPFGAAKHFHPADVKVGSIACSSDGRWIAVGLRSGTVLLLNGAGDVTQRLDATKHDVQAMAFSADGSLLGIATNDSATQLWDTRKGQRLATGSTSFGASTAVAFAPDGKLYVSADEDTVIRGFDSTGKEIYKAEADALEPFAVAFTPDGKRFAVAGGGGTISLFDAGSGRKLQTSATNGNPIFNIMMSPTGKQIAALELDDYRLEPVAITLWDLKDPALKKVDVDVKTVIGAGTNKSDLLLIKSDGPNNLSLWSIQ